MRVSIITLALDIPPFIDEAVASIPCAGEIDIEHIIIHDGSDREFAQLTERYPSLRILRGRGRGATAAANLALKHATGEFVFFLNSDDRMTPNALSALASAATRAPHVDIWTGATRLFKQDDRGREVTLRRIADRTNTILTLSNILDDFPLLTARFIRSQVYTRFSGLDESFQACSDREFMIRLTLAGVVEDALNEPVSELRLHENSSTIRLSQKCVPAYLAQHVEIARRWMADATVAPTTYSIFKDWHARELARIAFYTAVAGQWGHAIGIVFSGLARDPIWPWRARTILAARRRRRRNDRDVGSH